MLPVISELDSVKASFKGIETGSNLIEKVYMLSLFLSLPPPPLCLFFFCGFTLTCPKSGGALCSAVTLHQRAGGMFALDVDSAVREEM